LRVSVRLVVEGGPHAGLSRAGFVRRARAMLDAVQMGHMELSILLTGDDQIKMLNRVYRKKNRPTDVLAFAQREGTFGDRAGHLLGDVVISIPTTRRQAAKRGADFTSELTVLLAHGLLHLLGWDHDTPAKDRRMRRETDRLCEAAGAAAPRTGRPRALVKGTTKRRANLDSTARGGVRPTGQRQDITRSTTRPAAPALGHGAKSPKHAVFPLRNAKSGC
jgi:probable rRNA maturation factor